MVTIPMINHGFSVTFGIISKGIAINVRATRGMTISLACSIGFAGCVPLYNCSDQVRQSSASADSKLHATIYTRDCGATTSELVHVSISPANRARSEEDVVFTFKGEAETVKTTWISDNQLQIAYGIGVVTRQVNAYSGVQISYVEGKK